MASRTRFLALLAVVLVMAVPVARRRRSATTRAAEFEWFETKVRPILVDHCYTCHSADTKPAGGLRVDDRNGLLAGGNSGAAVVPGDPEASVLLKRVNHKNPNRRMPKEGQPLTDEQIAALIALDSRRSTLAAGEGSRVARPVERMV